MKKILNSDPLTIKIYSPWSLGDALQVKEKVENSILRNETISFSSLFLFPHIDTDSLQVLTLITERGNFTVNDKKLVNTGIGFEIPYNFTVESKKVKAFVKIPTNLIINIEIHADYIILFPEKPVHVRIVGKPYYQGRELPINDRLFLTEVKLSSTNILFNIVENDEDPEIFLINCDLVNNGKTKVKTNLASIRLFAELAFLDGGCDQPTNVPDPGIQYICYGPVPEGWYVANVTPWSICPDGYQIEIRKLGGDIIHCSSTHSVPKGYVISGVVPEWFNYNGMKFDKFICTKLGPNRITMCACTLVPEGYAIVSEISWSPCTGSQYCTSGKAYIIQKI
jgi:hypothetical protein